MLIQIKASRFLQLARENFSGSYYYNQLLKQYIRYA